MEGITAPYLTYENISEEAARLLHRFGRNNEIPVDVEALAEFDLKLNIVPARGLQDRLATDGFLSLDMREIYVDEWVMERHPTRYRFTLAHELGHMVLHGNVFESLRFEALDEWVQFVMSMPEYDYGWFERHAYWFAGALLVPEEKLLACYDKASAGLAANGLDTDALSDYSRSQIAGFIAKRFQVSTAVVYKRLREVSLW